MAGVLLRALNKAAHVHMTNVQVKLQISWQCRLSLVELLQEVCDEGIGVRVGRVLEAAKGRQPDAYALGANLVSHRLDHLQRKPGQGNRNGWLRAGAKCAATALALLAKPGQGHRGLWAAKSWMHRWAIETNSAHAEGHEPAASGWRHVGQPPHLQRFSMEPPYSSLRWLISSFRNWSTR
jgi:hypothetical protein